MDLFQTVDRFIKNHFTDPLDYTGRSFIGLVCDLTVGEFYHYDKDYFFKEQAKKKLVDSLPEGWVLERFSTEIRKNPTATYYGSLSIKASHKFEAAVRPKMSIKEVYEKNKTAISCVSCGRLTERRAVFSSAIGYCKTCCG